VPLGVERTSAGRRAVAFGGGEGGRVAEVYLGVGFSRVRWEGERTGMGAMCGNLM
jgi:hypothetical protein